MPEPPGPPFSNPDDGTSKRRKRVQVLTEDGTGGHRATQGVKNLRAFRGPDGTFQSLALRRGERHPPDTGQGMSCHSGLERVRLLANDMGYHPPLEGQKSYRPLISHGLSLCYTRGY